MKLDYIFAPLLLFLVLCEVEFSFSRVKFHLLYTFLDIFVPLSPLHLNKKTENDHFLGKNLDTSPQNLKFSYKS